MSDEAKEPFETFNRFIVAAKGDAVMVMNPPVQPMTLEEALNLCAWVFTLSGATREDLLHAIDAVENT